MAILGAKTSDGSNPANSIIESKIRSGLREEDKVCRFRYVQTILTTPDNLADVSVTSPSLIWEGSIAADGSHFACGDILQYGF